MRILDQNKRTIVVGNSPTVLDLCPAIELLNANVGQIINDFDVVVRTTNWDTKGYEKYVGDTTDVWVIGSSLWNENHNWIFDHNMSNISEVWASDLDSYYGVSHSFINKLRKLNDPSITFSIISGMGRKNKRSHGVNLKKGSIVATQETKDELMSVLANNDFHKKHKGQEDCPHLLHNQILRAEIKKSKLEEISVQWKYLNECVYGQYMDQTENEITKEIDNYVRITNKIVQRNVFDTVTSDYHKEVLNSVPLEQFRHEGNKQRFLSTGMYAILWALNRYASKKNPLYIHGFDFFQNKRDYYPTPEEWSEYEQSERLPSGFTTAHNGLVERYFVNYLIRKGYIINLLGGEI
tara:strand:- start:93 stop:1145 length:1053 start_codon:yes stop_codon:yes gene_type:complete